MKINNRFAVQPQFGRKARPSEIKRIDTLLKSRLGDDALPVVPARCFVTAQPQSRSLMGLLFDTLPSVDEVSSRLRFSLGNSLAKISGKVQGNPLDPSKATPSSQVIYQRAHRFASAEAQERFLNAQIQYYPLGEYHPHQGRLTLWRESLRGKESRLELILLPGNWVLIQKSQESGPKRFIDPTETNPELSKNPHDGPTIGDSTDDPDAEVDFDAYFRDLEEQERQDSDPKTPPDGKH